MIRRMKERTEITKSLPLTSSSSARMIVSCARPFRFYSIICLSLAKKQSSGKNSNFEVFEFKLNLNPQNFLFYSLPVIYLAWIIYNDQGGVSEISWNDFRNNYLEKGLVEKLVVVNRSIVRVFLKGDSGI